MHRDVFIAGAVPRRGGGSTHGRPALRNLATVTVAMAIMRDPETGEVRAILRDLPADAIPCLRPANASGHV